MPKTNSRRRNRLTTRSAPPASTLEGDISVVVDGDKVLPRDTGQDSVAGRAEAPQLNVAISPKTGKPTFTISGSAAARSERNVPAADTKSASEQLSSSRQPTASASAYGPDGAPVERQSKRPPDEADSQLQNKTAAAGKSDAPSAAVAAGNDLREIAKTVALSPAPEPTALPRVLAGLKTVAARVADTCERAWQAGKRWLARRGIDHPRDVGHVLAASQETLAQVALTLRIGLGALFVTGGAYKLSLLLSPATSAQIVATYTSTKGYINEFFMAFLFAPGMALTPWSFLTALSTFELVTGVMLLAGLLVRPVALIYAFLLWTFVIALPVVTTNGVDPGVKTYMAPAMLVQVRDIALSGFMFVLYGLGSGIRSVDVRIFGGDALKPVISWDVASLLLRLSLAVVLIVGGLFAGMPNIKTFIEPGLLLVVAGLALLWGGQVTRYAAGVVCAVLLVYMLGKLGLDKGLIGNLNAVKRELALFAGAFVLAARACGQTWTVGDVARRLGDGVTCARANVTGSRTASGLKPAE